MNCSTRTFLSAAAIALSAAACSGGGNPGSGPPVTQPPLSPDKAQLGVGVATFSDGTLGLNVVATFRQPSGRSATLVNTPTITGPFIVNAPAAGPTGGCPQSTYTTGLLGRAYLAGFAGDGTDYSAAGAAGVDAGTHTISGSPQTPPGNPVACTTLGEAGGVFAYGLSLQNQTTSQTANVGPQFFYNQPLYSTALQSAVPFLGGPPAYPNVQTGTYPAGFAGFSQGFLIFALGVPPAGTYSLDLLVPAANAPNTTFTASATLNSTAGLPAFPATPPNVTEDANGDGGLSVSFVAPTGVTENVVDIVDVGPNPMSTIAPRTSGPLFYTVLAKGSGPQTAVLPPNLGPVNPLGAGSPSIAVGDNYTISVIGADYPLFEAGPPANLSLTPTITGANNQADLTFAPITGNATVAGYLSKFRRSAPAAVRRTLTTPVFGRHR